MLANRKGSKTVTVKQNDGSVQPINRSVQRVQDSGRKLRSRTGTMDGDDGPRDQLSVFEKKFLLCSERGDVPAVRGIIEKHKDNDRFNINCRDAVGRTALVVAIENENMELIELLLKNGIQPEDALLHAISEEYVEAVEVLLQHEEKNYKPGAPYSWEAVDNEMATFTKDITPLVLAAHRDNYEIIKLLLDRGASLPMPHNVRCGCDDCIKAVSEDCLRHSQSRINAYRALSSPSLICLSSKDPVETAFNLSSELAKLSSAENEFKTDYKELRTKCEQYATALLDHTRTSYELEVMLNYDPKGPAYMKGERMKLERLKLAITCKQKTFVAHPNVQQLLASVWYAGSPGFRRKNIVGQLMDISKMGMMSPMYSMAYMANPESELGKTMKKPFTKFISHSTMYCFFLLLLIMASQRVETLVMQWIGTDFFIRKVQEDQLKERGKLPGLVESGIFLFVIGFIWAEIKQLWGSGLYDYLLDMWNMVDFFTNLLYTTCIGLRITAYYIVQRELSAGLEAYIPREEWDPYDPMLIFEGIFGAANIFSFLKMVHIFSVNPHLGPLQISLGRMVFDIMKFFFIYTLVLFAFGCGMNQLLWYYADMDKELCYSGPGGSQNPNNDQSCLIWRRFANLFETSQSLFWASFGLVELENFELTGIKEYTRFWSLLMFGSYSVINVVVLLNLLIAMMSNSYNIISERSDVEWKFARTKLWMSFFEDGDTVPPPFNIFPTPKAFKKLFACTKRPPSMSLKVKEESERDAKYRDVMRCLVRRYVTSQQLKAEDQGVTEDDVNEVKQLVTSFKSELFDILRANEFKGVVAASETLSRKERLRERRLLKDFNINIVETVMEAFMKDEKKNRFSIRRLATGKREKAKRNWNAIAGAARSRENPIGRTGGSRSGSLKELRTKVFKEEEHPEMRPGVRRFVSAARRVIEDDEFRARCEQNDITMIEEEVPGTFSANVTPRNSMLPGVPSTDPANLAKAVSEKLPQEPVEKSPKTTTEQPPKVTDKAPKQPTDKSPGQPGQKSPVKSTDKSPTQPTDKSATQPTDKSSMKPADKSSKQPEDKSGKQTSDKLPKKSTDKDPTDKPPKQPSDKSPKRAPRPPRDKSPKQATDKSPKKTGDKSPKKSTDKSPKKTTDKPPRKSADKSTKSPTDKPSKQPADKSKELEADKSKQPADKASKPLADKPPKDPMYKASKPIADKPSQLRKSSDVILEIEKDVPQARSKKLDSCPTITISEPKKETPSKVKGLVSKFDQAAGDKKEEASPETRRHSEPGKKRDPKVFPEDGDEPVKWI